MIVGKIAATIFIAIGITELCCPKLRKRIWDFGIKLWKRK